MIKYYVYTFIGFFVAILISIFFVIKLESKLYERETLKISGAHESIKKNVKEFKKTKDDFLLMIPKNEAVLGYLKKRDRVNYEEVKRFLFSLSLSDKNIFQLRILDTSGEELIRVDRSKDNKLFYMPVEKLQNKFNRNYFQDFIKLQENSVGFSDLDLNMENGKVELPWHPTLRMGTPIFINNQKVGLVIINYCMKHWIAELSNFTRDNLYLLDKEGYFIYHPKDEWKWSKYKIPSAKADEYFDQSNIKNRKNSYNSLSFEEYYNKKNNLYIEKVQFFNNEDITAIYEPKIPINNILIDDTIDIVIYIFLAFLAIGIPVFLLLYTFINTLHKEKEKLHLAKEHITSVFNSTSEAIFVIDKLAIIKDLNAAAIKLFSYEKSELIGKNIKILIPEPHKTKHDQYVRNYKNDGMARFFDMERELYALSKEQKPIPITLTITSIKESNEVLFMGSIKDISQIREAKTLQAEQETMLLQQSKFAAMGEMLTAIAHQWRQPLNSIGLIVQDLVSAEKYKELTTQYLKNSSDGVLKQLNLMSSTIDEFRNFFSKDNIPRKFNILDAIKEVENLYWAQFKANNILLEIWCEEKLYEEKKDQTLDSYLVYNVASELKQVLLNILANAKDAIVHMKNANTYQRTIRVSLKAQEDEVIINIADRAGGMSLDIVNRVFDPYYTTKEMGTGLGLFIVKTLVDKHIKGSITCEVYESEYEGVSYLGTSFIIRIPKKLEYSGDKND